MSIWVDKIEEMIKENKMILFMKGTPYNPQCGFSARTVQALIECEVEFSYIDILENPEIRAVLPDVSDWPTFPQLFFEGELLGGCDIITEMHSTGELKKVITEDSN
jgi:monothiol glutaredoxin|tara:strand:+ start:5405 stop:5722 length:318 start_codon:yes stop_codon:yes gene_type:complete